MSKSFYELEQAARVLGVCVGPQGAEQDAGSPDEWRRREDVTLDEPLLSR